GGGYRLRQAKVGTARQQGNPRQLAQFARRIPLHPTTFGHQSGSWMVCLLRAATVSGPERQRALRLTVDLAVGSVKRRRQKGAAGQGGGISDGRYSHIKLRSGKGIRRQRCRNKYRSDILHP